MFLNGPTMASFCLFSSFSNTNFTEILLTQAGFELVSSVEMVSTLTTWTTTTAPTVKMFLSIRCSLLPFPPLSPPPPRNVDSCVQHVPSTDWKHLHVVKRKWVSSRKNLKFFVVFCHFNFPWKANIEWFKGDAVAELSKALSICL